MTPLKVFSPASENCCPRPVDSLLTWSQGVTVATLIWNHGDTKRCSICRSCRAIHGRNVCQITVKGEHADESSLLSALGFRDNDVVGVRVDDSSGLHVHSTGDKLS